MRRIVLLLASLALLGSLAACGGAGTNEAAPAASGTITTEPADALSPLMQLVLGTLALEDTELAVGAAQAQELLPLWKAYRSLSASDTTAPQELAALEEQIAEAMTTEQRAAIAEMSLTRDDMVALMGEMHIEDAFAMPEGLSAEDLAARRAQGTGGLPGGEMAPGGMAPGGMAPGGMGRGGMPAGGVPLEGMPPENTVREPRVGEWGTPGLVPLVNALIAVLESKV